MIAASSPFEFFLRLVAPFVWRSQIKIAAKLDSFASTEAGSALDMLKAAELTDDPKLRRLFFRHAMDEARHAQLFRDASRRVCPDLQHRGSEYSLIHARRQNLFAQMSLVSFIAFVFLAERRGEAQFRALSVHFKDDAVMQALFAQIAKDERFHVAYSKSLLSKWRKTGQGRDVRAALLHVRWTRAFEAWKRAGRVLGDLMTRVVLGAVYLVVLPVFAWIARGSLAEAPGWRTARILDSTLDDARRQS